MIIYGLTINLIFLPNIFFVHKISPTMKVCSLGEVRGGRLPLPRRADRLKWDVPSRQPKQTCHLYGSAWVT